MGDGHSSEPPCARGSLLAHRDAGPLPIGTYFGDLADRSQGGLLLASFGAPAE